MSQVKSAMTLAVGTWSLMYLLNITLYLLAAGIPSVHFVVLAAIVCLLGIIFSIALFFIARAVGNWNPLARGAVLTLAVIVLAALLAVFDAAGAPQIGDAIPGVRRHLSVSAQAVNNFAIMVWQFGLLAAAFAMLDAYRVAQERLSDLALAKQRAVEAERTATAARLAALRYQLNPHFLFNTMNSISSLVVTRRNEEAEDMLSRLSDFLRATLGGDPNEMVSVDCELSTLQSYLEVESLRFGDRLEVQVDCPPMLRDVLIPGFLLQPLVENAIKYGVTLTKQTVTLGIAIRSEKDHLEIAVTNNGSRTVAAIPRKSGGGVGHANIRERLKVLYGDLASFDAGPTVEGYSAVLRLPVAIGDAA